MGLVSGDTVLDWLGDLWSCACGYEKHVVATDKDRLTMIIVTYTVNCMRGQEARVRVNDPGPPSLQLPRY